MRASKARTIRAEILLAREHVKIVGYDPNYDGMQYWDLSPRYAVDAYIRTYKNEMDKFIESLSEKEFLQLDIQYVWDRLSISSKIQYYLEKIDERLERIEHVVRSKHS